MTEQLAWVGDRFLRLVLGESLSPRTHERVREATFRLRRGGVRGLVDVTPAYATVLLTFELRDLDGRDAERDVRRALRTPVEEERSAQRNVRIAVCYDPDLGPDLEDVGRRHGLRPQDVVALHSEAEYLVQFLGFSPGFPYLAGLAERLHTPRLDRPRVRVPAGSVAIAGAQAGIYPQATPGGWRLLGRTPHRLFDPASEAPVRLALGDRVRFVPVARERFEEIGAAEGAGERLSP